MTVSIKVIALNHIIFPKTTLTNLKQNKAIVGQDVLHVYPYTFIESVSQLAIKLFFPLFFTSQEKDKKNGFALDSATIAKPNLIGYVASQNQTEVKPSCP